MGVGRIVVRIDHPFAVVRAQQKRQARALLINIQKKKPFSTSIAVADVHGRGMELAYILNRPVVRRAKEVVFLGDYGDRGRQSPEVYTQLSGFDRGIFLIGNHEAFILLAMAGARNGFVDWLAEGGFRWITGVISDPAFLQAFRAAQNQFPSIPYEGEVVDALDRDQPKVIDSFHQQVLAHPYFQEVFNWLLLNGRLYHINLFSMLCVHAGMDLRARGGNGVASAAGLHNFERFLFEALQKQNRWKVEGIVGLVGNNLEMRPDAWLTFLKRTPEKEIRRRLLERGLRGLIVGHDWKPSVRPVKKRVFGVNYLYLDGSVQGCGGFLEMGPRGIIAHRFLKPGVLMMEEELLMLPQDFRDRLADDLPELIRRL